MLNLIHAEFYKLSKSTGAKVCFILIFVSAAVLMYISHCVAIGSMSEDISSSASGLTEIMMISLFGSLMAGILVCSDFETKTIHDAVASGNGRKAVVISKVLVYIVVISLLLLPYAVTVIIGYCTGAEFSAQFVASAFVRILADQAGTSVTASGLGKIIFVYLVTVIVYAARISICIPLAFKVRKPVVVMGFGFASGALIELANGLLKDVPVLGNLISYTPYARTFTVITTDLGTNTLLKATISSIVFIGIMTGLTYSIFKKTEIN
jgi:ABC-2 type transport system permease protein